MKLNHLNLVVPNVRETGDFLQTHFGLRPSSHNTDDFVMLFDEDGFLLSLFQSSENSPPPHYPAGFHVGFVQSSEEKVNQINQRLKDAGLDVKPPRRIHGSWTFYLKVPGGFLIEVLY